MTMHADRRVAVNGEKKKQTKKMMTAVVAAAVDEHYYGERHARLRNQTLFGSNL